VIELTLPGLPIGLTLQYYGDTYIT